MLVAMRRGDETSVEGFYVKSVGPIVDEYLPLVPLRVLFGRSGAGKSSVLTGLTQACFGLRTLSRRRNPIGDSSLILKLGDDGSNLVHALNEADAGDRVPMDADVAELDGQLHGLQEKFNQRIGEAGLAPPGHPLHLWTLAALIGDDDLADIATAQVSYASAEIYYPIESLYGRAAEIATELAGGVDGRLVTAAEDVADLRLVTMAFLNSPHIMIYSARFMTLALDPDPEVAAALVRLAASYEHAESTGLLERGPTNSLGGVFVQPVSSLYWVAKAHRTSRERWLCNPSRKLEVDISKRGEFFEGSLDGVPTRAVDLGGTVEQSVDDFETSLTDAMPALHDRLLRPALISDRFPEQDFWIRSLQEDELNIVHTGLLRPLSGPNGGSDPWLEQLNPAGGVRTRQTVEACCKLLERRANELLPDFLREHGEIMVEPLPIGSWTLSSRKRIGIRLGQDGSAISLEFVASGVRRWLLAVVDWAYQEILASTIAELAEATSEGWGVHERAEIVGRLHECELVAGEQTGVLIVDEPELHLDPRTQLQVAEWLKDVSREGTSVVLASHSPAFLTYQTYEATLTAVVRTADPTNASYMSTSLLDMSKSLLDWCSTYGEEVGLTNADAILLSRGFIVVEGPHDSKALRKFFWSELDDARIQLLHLYGTQGEQALIDSEYLVGLGKPIGILLDNVKDIDQIMREDKYLTHEEQALKRMVSGLKRRGVHPFIGGHPWPDVMCALPEEAVRQAFPKANFPGWEELEARFKATRPDGTRKVRRVNFKTFALREMNLELSGVHSTKFVDEVLGHCAEDAAPRKGLRRAVSELLADLTR